MTGVDGQLAYVVFGGSGAVQGATSTVPTAPVSGVDLPGLFDVGQGTCTAGASYSFTVAPNDADPTGLAVGFAGCVPSAAVPASAV